MGSLLLDCGARSARRALYQGCIGHRVFSSSSGLSVGPESPNFIYVPKSIQPDKFHHPQVKGTLPVPREVFPRRRPDKPTESFISEATPKPSAIRPQLSPNNPHVEQVEWKRKMADLRRKNFREGISQLYQRKTQTERRLSAKSSAKQKYRAAIQSQPRRDDELLTSSTIVSTMQPTRSATLPDPNAEGEVAASMAKVQARQEERRERILDSIQTLYTNATKFIVSEEQLYAEIDRAFPTENNPDWANDRTSGDSVWNLGAPPTMASLVEDQKNKESAKWEMVQRRTKKLAEELTGGKI